jgi:hypothetical protein
MEEHAVDYASLSVSEIRQGLAGVAEDAQATFGGLDRRQLNWRPDASRWSVAQCFEHLLTTNELMFRAAEQALGDAAARSIWQRLPILPAVLGRMMVRSQSPGATRRFTAPAKAHPANSEIEADIVRRFISQQRDAVVRLQALDDDRASRVIMTSPFVRVVTYSVLDGWRLVLAHDRRHFEQAGRVARAPGFPA